MVNSEIGKARCNGLTQPMRCDVECSVVKSSVMNDDEVIIAKLITNGNNNSGCDDSHRYDRDRDRCHS